MFAGNFRTDGACFALVVLLACRDVPLARVEEELARRFGVSGLEEKAARTAGNQGGAG